MTALTEPRFFPLSKVVGRIDQLLRPAMEKTFWVKAELSSAMAKGDNFYCELVESQSSGHGANQMVAKVRCAIFGTEMRRIRAKFDEQGLELKLNDGTVVGMLCRVQFHPVYGLSLRGLDMDPSFALGELELRKKAIMENLVKLGLDRENKKRELCSLPVKIALITGEGTAAYYDFTKTLFASKFGFELHLAGATMQGEYTESSILKALSFLSSRQLDLVVICRGGGSKVDLSWLDSEPLARAVAEHPHPVWTGIGHDIDYGVLDLVSHESFKTPTAIAEALVARFEGMEQYIQQAQHNLKSVWEYRSKEQSEFLFQAQKGLGLGTRKLLDHHRAHVMRAMEGLNGRVQMRLKGLKQAWSQKKESLLERPKHRLRWESERCLRSEAQLERGARSMLDAEKRRLSDRQKRWRPESISKVLMPRRDDLERQTLRLLKGPIWSRLKSETEMNASKLKMLRTADPERNLKRGYAIVRNPKGRVLEKSESIQLGDRLELQLGRGRVKAKVDEVISED